MWEIEKLKEYADVYGKAEAVMDAIAAKLRKEPEEAGKMEREMIRVIQETPMRDEYFIFYLSALIQLFPRAAPDNAVLQIKSLEAFAKAADGQATKIIIPSDIQGIAGLSKSIVEIAKENG